MSRAESRSGGGGNIRDLIGQKTATAPLPGGVEVLANAILRVPVELIDPSPEQPRRAIRTDAPSFIRLRDNIKANGLLQAVGLRRNPDNPERFFLRWGGRRLEAFKVLAREDARFRTIPGTLEEGDERSVKQRIYDGLAENNRENLDALEEGEKYLELIELYGERKADIVRSTGESEDHIERCLTLARAPDMVKRAFTEGVRVPKLDAENNPMMREEEETQEDGSKRKVSKPVLVTKTMTDTFAALELVKLHKFLQQQKPRVANKVFHQHFERVIAERMTFREVKELVRRIRAGGERKQRMEAEGMKARTPEAPVQRLLQGSVYKDDEEQLVVDKTKIGTLSPEKRQPLLEALQGLIAVLKAGTA